jgi:hypothetical protein
MNDNNEKKNEKEKKIRSKHEFNFRDERKTLKIFYNFIESLGKNKLRFC